MPTWLNRSTPPRRPGPQGTPAPSSSPNTGDGYLGPNHQPAPDSIVYLVQEPSVPKHSGRTLDLMPLTWWGQVRVLMEKTQKASFRPAPSFEQIGERLRIFDPERDYIAVAGGDTLAVLMVGAALAQLGHRYFHYLRFERTTLPDGSRDPASGVYVPIRVPLVRTTNGPITY
jgi:hypothetical protein